MLKWLKENKVVTVLLTFVRIYLGWTWFMAGWHKIVAATPFDATGYLTNAVNNPVIDRATNEAVYPIFTAFLKHFALPNVNIVNVLVPWGELFIGIGLIVGGLTTIAVICGLMMNFMFMFAGTISTNPWLTLIGVIILVTGTTAGKYGIDYYLLPYVRTKLTKLTWPKKKITAHN